MLRKHSQSSRVVTATMLPGESLLRPCAFTLHHVRHVYTCDSPRLAPQRNVLCLGSLRGTSGCACMNHSAT
jgi:hypothetical protein